MARFIAGAILGIMLMAIGNYDSSHWIMTFTAASIGTIILTAMAYVANQAPPGAVTKVFGAYPTPTVYFTLGVGALWFFMGLITFIVEPGDPMSYTKWEKSISSVLYGLVIYLPATLLYYPMVIIFPIVLGITIVSIVPYFTIGIEAMRTTTTTFEAMKDHAKYGGGEKRIADAIQTDTAIDARQRVDAARGTAVTRKREEFRSAVMEERYNDMEDVLKRQEEQIRARSKAAKAANDTERARRSDS